MEHLGSQTKLPVGQSTLSEYPTRVMSTIVNHEKNWYNGNGVASNEDKDLGEQDATNMFPDFGRSNTYHKDLLVLELCSIKN